jgi:hypothetical protein
VLAPVAISYSLSPFSNEIVRRPSLGDFMISWFMGAGPWYAKFVKWNGGVNDEQINRSSQADPISQDVTY